LAALIVVVLAWLQCRKLKHDEAVLNALPPTDRLQHLEHNGQRRWIETIGLATGEENHPVRMRLKAQRRKLYVSIGVATALSFVTVYCLGTRYGQPGMMDWNAPPLRE
jgi:hypothetical protein